MGVASGIGLALKLKSNRGVVLGPGGGKMFLGLSLPFEFWTPEIVKVCRQRLVGFEIVFRTRDFAK